MSGRKIHCKKKQNVGVVSSHTSDHRGETHLGNGGTIHKINGADRAEAGQHWADDRYFKWI